MTDLEITRLCAEAIGLTLDFDSKLLNGEIYRPLHNDAQAMALVKKFGLTIHGKPNFDSDSWYVVASGKYDAESIDDLNRAICECVAKMQQVKASA